ncbi:MAG: hypothetical protein HYV32_04715 [Candidatus Kerfeldbacteria bacterium]|nr:hypothetical protein [Candidatus Kerfeldbacteria bacterium]
MKTKKEEKKKSTVKQKEKEQKVHLSPKDVFMHLLVIVTLYFSAASFLTLLFQYVNVWFPDPLFSGGYTLHYQGPLRFAISSLIIVFPGFMVTSWLLTKEYRKDINARNMRLRKWLIFFTLFLATIIIGGDLVSIVYNFLDGELTMRFFLKALSVLLVAGTIFGYYLWDVHQEKPARDLRMIAWPVIAIVFAAIIGGFFIAGSPQQQRLYRLDEKRVSDLSALESAVYGYWNDKGELPTEMNQLSPYIYTGKIPTDPQADTTGDQLMPPKYSYNVTGTNTFELCAKFSKSSDDASSSMSSYIYSKGVNSWNHPAGRYCFSREISNDTYPTPL